MTRSLAIGVLFAIGSAVLAGCSSGPDIKKEAYAQLKDQRTFEYEFAVVWKGIEDTVRNWKITDRDPSKVDAVEMRHLRHRTLKSDWIYTRSTDKYVEYKVNDLPRKTFLQTRLRYVIDAQTVLGGVQVTVHTNEEVEKLNNDGSPDGWATVDQVDSSRASNLLDQINQSILAEPNTQSPDEI